MGVVGNCRFLVFCSPTGIVPLEVESWSSQLTLDLKLPSHGASPWGGWCKKGVGLIYGMTVDISIMHMYVCLYENDPCAG